MKYYGKPRPVAATMNRIPAVILLIVVTFLIAADILIDIGLNWVDYVIIIIIAFFGFKGYFKGLVNTIFSFVGYALGLIIAFILSPKLSLFAMEKTSLGSMLGEKIDEVVPALSSINTIKISDANTALDILNSNPELSHAISDNPLLEQLISITTKATDTSAAYATNVTTVNDFIVYSLLRIIALVVLFVAVKLVIFIIGKILTSVLSSSAILGTANRTGGMAIGFAAGIIICYMVFILLVPALGSINIINIPKAYTDSTVLKWSNNLLFSLNKGR